MTALLQVLQRCIDDRSFVESLREDPLRALKDYEDLSDREREILSQRDVRLLELLGEAYASSTSEVADPSPAAEAVEPTAQQVTPANHATPLVKTRLALRLVPYASQTDQGELVIHYAAHVDPLPGQTSMAALQPPPVQAGMGQPLPLLGIQIHIQPFAIPQEQGQAITFDVKASPDMPLPDSSAAAAPEEHPKVQDAVAAVQAAEDAERVDRLLDLIGLLEAGGDKR